MRKTILIVDDEMSIIELLTMNLEKQGYEIQSCFTGEEAVRLAKTNKPDLILLDLMLPVMSGLEVCRILRLEKATKEIPIIMLTAKGEINDMLIGFELGADDYIIKPFRMKELFARVKAVLRRTEKVNPNESWDSLLRVKDIEMNTQTYSVTKGDQKIELTLKEYNLLKMLLENPERVLTREQLLREISKEDESPELRSIDVHITNLRRKLGHGKDGNDYIETIRGIGYRLK